MRASLRPLALAAVAVAACSSDRGDALRVAISPTILLPRGLLDTATSLTLDVYDATTTGVGCDSRTSVATGVAAGTARVASLALRSDNCAASAKFCGSVQITKSTDTLVFAAVATNGTGGVVANGCVSATVNSDELDLAIPMIRYVPPATCGNGVIEPTEQCDPPGSASDTYCDTSCHSKELVLATTGITPPERPSFLWPTQLGEPGRFFAFFTTSQPRPALVGLRVMSDALTASNQPPAAANELLAPNDSTGPFPPVPGIGNQKQASGAFVSSTYWYAFVDDGQNANDIHLRSFDHSLTALQPAGGPIGVNGPGGAGEANQQLHPSIAVGPGGKLLVAWQDVSGPFAGQVMARTYDPTTGTLGTQQQISSGAGNQEIQVAATARGWLATWDDGSTIKLRAIDGNGTPSGGEIVVSDPSHGANQDHPGLAVLPDGSAAVVWCDHTASKAGEIFVQRFDPNLTAVSGDQARAINDVLSASDQVSPSIAGSSAAGGSYVAVWIDKSSGSVRGRVLDATGGFLFNPIDGQTTEFEASIGTGAGRDNPGVAIGGAGPWVAIGWNDGANVTARRFPAPTK